MRYLQALGFSLLLAAAALSGCVTTDDSDPPHLYAGMSRDHLRSHFGDPVRIEPGPAGGEIWYYVFQTWSSPQVETSSSFDPYAGRSDSVSVTMSDAKATQECPVHISAEGYVTDPIPPGKIVPR